MDKLTNRLVTWKFGSSAAAGSFLPESGVGVVHSVGHDSAEDSWQDFMALVEMGDGRLLSVPVMSSNMRVTPARTEPRPMSEAPQVARVWVGSDGTRMHAGLFEWLGLGAGWVRTSGGLPIKAGTIFVPAGHPVPDGEPLSVTPCSVVDWLPASSGEGGA